MKIDLIANDGSPLGVTCKTIYGEDGKMGVGGAELALLTLCEAWHEAGHRVTLYNNPRVPGGSPFEQRAVDKFQPNEDRDVLIIFRSPNPKAWGAKGLRVWWSTDQHTMGDFSQFGGAVHKIVTISPFHKEYFKFTYRLDSTVIDLPVRLKEYAGVGVQKVHKRCIFTSVPDRGLQILRDIWPAIRQAHPDATLVITSDYRLWGVDAPMNEQHRANWLGTQGVTFRGAVNRRDLIKEQLAAEFHLYPSTYEELFCISVAESLVAGALPITSDVGAVETTNMGVIIAGRPEDTNWKTKCIEVVKDYMNEPNLEELVAPVQCDAVNRFSPARILHQWNTKIFQQG